MCETDLCLLRLIEKVIPLCWRPAIPPAFNFMPQFSRSISTSSQRYHFLHNILAIHLRLHSSSLPLFIYVTSKSFLSIFLSDPLTPSVFFQARPLNPIFSSLPSSLSLCITKSLLSSLHPLFFLLSCSPHLRPRFTLPLRSTDFLTQP